MNTAYLPFVSALLGALLGGLIAHVNGRHFAKRQEDRQVAQEKQRQRDINLALAHSIVFKVHQAFNFIWQSRAQILSAKEVATHRQWPLWQAMQEFFTGERERVKFEASELALFAGNNDAEFATQLLELAAVNNLVADIYHDYAVRREAFGDKALENGKFELKEGKITSFQTDSPAAQLLALRLDQLAQSLDDITGQGAQHAHKVYISVSGKLRDILQDSRFNIDLGLPENPGS